MSEETASEATVNVRPNGPYLLSMGVPVRRTEIVQSEHGEPMAYDHGDEVDCGPGLTALCRCGASSNKPFCDGTHSNIEWNDAETASGTYADRSNELGGTGITVRDDRSVCVHAGFCGTRAANVWKLTGETDESLTRMQVINMVEKCPSGALTYSLGDATEANEPRLPVEVAVLKDGPLYLEGGIDVISADGKAYETRNRATLCRCGHSANKPYCDGKHKEAGFTD
ncbi:MAG: CDGSH-type Zn-finger protein [Candidatus Poriferisodalaceae bacterium]|jgi:CDGSH-type Zn-finger protein/ferredoxin